MGEKVDGQMHVRTDADARAIAHELTKLERRDQKAPRLRRGEGRTMKPMARIHDSSAEQVKQTEMLREILQELRTERRRSGILARLLGSIRPSFLPAPQSSRSQSQAHR